MIAVNTREAKTKLSELLAKIETEHESVIICRNGKPTAELIPWKNLKDPLKQDDRLKDVIFKDDPSLPLDEDEWPINQR